MNRPIYMDHHATTPVDPRVLEAMRPWFTEKFGNPASVQHAYGREAEDAVDRARAQVAALVGAADPSEIVFTSGATEADNLAVRGVVVSQRERNPLVVTTAIEHKAVLDTCEALAREGLATVTRVAPGRGGIVDAADVAAAIDDRTALVSVMHANNEIGTIQPVAGIGRACKERGVLFHSDAAQSAGKIPVDVQAMGIDLLSLSAHKLYGPKGVGALYVRKRHPRVKLSPILHGGGHERGLRPGTLPTPLLVGFGEACEIAGREREDEARRLLALRTRLWEGLKGRLGHVHLNGDAERRLPGNLNVSFEYVEGESLLLAMGVAVSSGSACTTATKEPSHVLRAIGLTEPMVQSSLRFGLGRGNTQEEVDDVVARTVAAVERLRTLSPLYKEVVQ